MPDETRLMPRPSFRIDGCRAVITMAPDPRFPELRYRSQLYMIAGTPDRLPDLVRGTMASLERVSGREWASAQA